MNYTENYEGIKLDVQAVDITVSEDVQEAIRKTISKLMKYAGEINWADVYLTTDPAHSAKRCHVSFRLGVPGPDVYASDAGDDFVNVLRSVEEKLESQLRKKQGK